MKHRTTVNLALSPAILSGCKRQQVIGGTRISQMPCSRISFASLLAWEFQEACKVRLLESWRSVGAPIYSDDNNFTETLNNCGMSPVKKSTQSIWALWVELWLRKTILEWCWNWVEVSINQPTRLRSGWFISSLFRPTRNPQEKSRIIPRLESRSASHSRRNSHLFHSLL